MADTNDGGGGCFLLVVIIIIVIFTLAKKRQNNDHEYRMEQLNQQEQIDSLKLEIEKLKGKNEHKKTNT